MNYILPFNNYIVLTPSGNMIGFIEKDDCINYVTGYELTAMLDFKNSDADDGYYDFYGEQDQKDFGTIQGVDNGDCEIYDLDSIIQAVRNTNIYQSEKDEIIADLLKETIKINIYDLGIDHIVKSVDALWNV